MGNTFRLWREVLMPWKASSVMEERLRFVARLLDGEAMTDVCREFGISRKTGYKIFDRYKEHGLAALSDRSRRPVRYANQLPQQIEGLIVRLKGEKPHWGARKIRELLIRRLDGDVRVPAKSTIHAVLDRHGLVKRGGGPRQRARGTPLSEGAAPNDLWCADFKGEFKLACGHSPRPVFGWRVPAQPHAAWSAFTGSVNSNVAPKGTFGVTHSRPPWASMIERQIESPIPMPLDFVVKKASNSRPAFSVEIPTPQSVTLTCTCCVSSWLDWITSWRERSVTDCMASIPFITRLIITCCK